jgi:hypothetical protein
LWLILRRLWPCWRDALVLVQPATVNRWHRERFDRHWRRRSHRAGRPRIDSRCSALIRRLAAENRLWGAPRIRGELLKLGIAGSERAVSRYLAGRLRAPSQTWPTFLANHLSQITSISQVTSPCAPHADDVVEESGPTFRQTLLPRDGKYVPDPCDCSVACFASQRVTWHAFRSGSPSRRHCHSKHQRPGAADAWTAGLTHVCARSGDWSSSVGPLDERHG